MPRNKISYQGRIVSIKNGQKQPLDINVKAGKTSFLNLVLAEQHQTKNKQCKGNLAKYADPSKGTEDYVNTTTSWHRLTVFGEKAEAYAQDPDFNHGALLDVEDAAYSEEADWITKDGVARAGRPETISNGEIGSLSVRFPPRYQDNETPMAPAWDPITQDEIGYNGRGGGSYQDTTDYENEGL
jgi:hypothetical protein